MKLMICIINDDDVHNLTKELVKNEYRVTKLASTGGFLKSGNTTIFLGVEEDKVDPALKIIENICKVRKELVTSTALSAQGAPTLSSFPIEITVGGATVFIVDVENYVRI